MTYSFLQAAKSSCYLFENSNACFHIFLENFPVFHNYYKNFKLQTEVE